MSWLFVYISALYCTNINTSIIFHSLFILSIILNYQHHYAFTFYILFYRLIAQWLILLLPLLKYYSSNIEISVPTTDSSTMPSNFQQQAESSTFGNIRSNRLRPPPPNRPNLQTDLILDQIWILDQIQVQPRSLILRNYTKQQFQSQTLSLLPVKTITKSRPTR